MNREHLNPIYMPDSKCPRTIARYYYIDSFCFCFFFFNLINKFIVDFGIMKAPNDGNELLSCLYSSNISLPGKSTEKVFARQL